MLNRIAALLLAVAVLATAGAGAIGVRDWVRRDATVAKAPPKTSVVVTAPPSATPTPTPAAVATPTPTPTPLPASALIQVPFTIQAPYQNWDAAHQEYCEAAAVYMVGEYYAGHQYPKEYIPPATADAAMASIVAWERQTFPGVVNLPLSDMIQDGQQFYGMTGSVQPLDLSVIQRDLAQGMPVIIPVMTHGGPGGSMIYPTYGTDNVYHVIVLVGYDQAKGIVYTNDAGLREGQNLAYPWATLQTAVASQAQTAVDASGAKVPSTQGTSMLVFSKPA